ncbi:MAG: MBL fold metallo-hydrolase [Candidatus Hecatellales archaeon]|nr:MAG: MBL fold metallo-hydrolase [Candidatus Hecatellales archaeon]
MDLNIVFKPIWFDSFGAKSSCSLIKTPNLKILIDPGVAAMQPSFPAPENMKSFWYEEGYKAIKSASKNVDVVVVSHYHYDHFIDFEKTVYEGKTVFAKNPNEFINDSQRGRAEEFYKHLYETFSKEKFENLLRKPKPKEYKSPLENLPLAKNEKFGDYEKRRKNLLAQGEKWFFKRVEKWNRYKVIPELELGKVKVKFPEGKEYRFGGTKLRFTKPLFHGIEFSRVGWVFSTVVEYGKEKLIHTSDLNGPIIEDYAKWIIKENPTTLILDGPMTYMLGYTLNLINFRRTIKNVLRIVEETSKIKTIIYDHHLPREPKFKERTKEVWEKAKKLGIKMVTAAEFVGRKTVVLEYA